MNKIFYIVLFLICLGLVTQAQQIPDIEINLKPGKYTVDQVLDILNQYEGINLVYNASPDEFESFVVLNRQSYKLKDILDIICEELVYDYTIKQDYIILKKRKLEDSYRLKGVIRDTETGGGLMAANVFLYKKQKGVVANDTGYFEIDLPPGNYTLICSYVGFDPIVKEVYLFKDRYIEFNLKPGENQIDEAQIVGQKSELKELRVGRTIQTLDRKSMEEVKLNNVTDVLQGRLKGVWLTKTSGAPGDQQKIRIRGINSILGSVEPLYVVDGVPVPVVNMNSMGIADLNVHDIETVSILKDASSTALYGYLGGNGVILIETRKGSAKNSINFYTMHGVQEFDHFYNVSDSRQFLDTYYLSDSLFGTKYFYNEDDPYARFPVYDDSMYTTNWQERLFQRGIVDEYLLSSQGSNKWFNHYISGDYYKHQGVVRESQYEKFVLSANIEKSFNRFKIGANYRGASQDNRNNINAFEGNNNIVRSINLDPSYESTPDSFLYKRDRYLTEEYRTAVSEILDLLPHQDELLDESQMKNKVQSSNIRLYGDIFLFEGLKAAANIGISQRKTIHTSDYYAKFLKSTDNYTVINQTYSLSYNRLFAAHEFTGNVTYRNYRDNVFWTINDYENLDITQFEPEPDMYQKGSMSIYGSQGSVVRRINSIVPAINYSFKQKYFFSALINFDHIELGEYSKKQSNFPSVAFNWDISREPLMNRINKLDHFNLYLNWGQVGNFPLISTANDLYQNIVPGYEYEREGQYLSNLANKKLSHEVIEEWNYGVEVSTFNNRMVLNFDYFDKNITDLLLQRSTPYFYGGGSVFVNVGEMQNTGYEFSLEATPVLSKNFQWDMRFNYSANKQIVSKLQESDTIFIDSDHFFTPRFNVQVGTEIGDIYGYKYLGLWTDEDALDTTFQYIERFGGKYLNNDTSNNNLQRDDMVKIGNSIPDFTCSFQTSFRYKKFNVSMLWYAVYGVDKFNSTRATMMIKGVHDEAHRFVTDSIEVIRYLSYYQSSAFIEDASFLRLKNLTFSYEFDKLFNTKLNATLSLTLENLLTISNYSGYDPEAAIYTNNNFSDNAIDMGAYPNPKGYYVSLNLRF